MTKPYRYQLKGIRKIQHFNGRGLVGDEMGLGKSLQALLWAKRYLKGRPIIIVCPAGVKWHWERECSLHANMRAHIIEGRKVPQGPLLQKYEVVIINYDILRPWLKRLQSLKPALIIIDECHYIKNRSAKRTKTVKLLCKKVKHIIALSGTPLTNRPAELWPILNILRRDLFPSFFSFASRYCSPKRAPWGWEYKGAVRLKELNRKLLQYLMIRRRKSEVLKDLPPKAVYIVPIAIAKRRQYTMALTDFRKFMQKYYRSKMKRALKAERLVQMGYLKRLVGQLKIIPQIEWIDNFLEESEGKILIFGYHKKVLRTLHNHYKPLSVLVDGSVTGKARQFVYDKFTKSKRIRILFGNIQAAGVGWNGIAAANVGIIEFPWTPGELNQAIDRAHRIGQKKAVSVFLLIAKDTIEEDLYSLLQKKQKVLDSTLDGRQGVDVNIFDQLSFLLVKRRK